MFSTSVVFGPASSAGEGVLVDLLNSDGLSFLYGTVVGDHEFAKAAAVNQDDPGGDFLGEADGARREACGGDEDASRCLGSL